jgi:hypothetical protein
MSSIKQPKKGPEEFQNFGSTSLRFKTVESFKPVAGPGSYEAPGSIINVKKIKIYIAFKIHKLK